MTNSPQLDDTQPKSPFREIPGEIRRTRTVYPDQPPPSNPGCGMMGLIGGIFILFSVAIVGLAGAAGWTTGQREANVYATATQENTIREQLDRIPIDINSGNIVLLDTRLRFLESLGVPQVNEIAPTATALFLTMQPTVTPTATLTPDALATTAIPEATQETELQITPSGTGRFDLASILQQAQTAFDSGQYEAADEYLSVILAADESFETTRVRQLMSRALNAQARELYNANQPAAANLLVDRARLYGALEDGLEYESYAATLYLNARAAIGTDYGSAINALREVVNLGQGGRYYNEALNLLFNQYVAYGDAWAAQGQYCPAEQQYRNALNVLNSGSVSAKMNSAANFCLNGTPTPDPLLGVPGSTPGGQPIAPIGVPGS
jgi:hypothetical protein